MIKEAFEYLFSRGESAGKAAIHEIGAEHYVSADHKLQAVRPPRPYLASAREIHTLDGLAAYLEHCPADLEIDSTAILDRVPLIHIVSPTCVHLTTLLFDNRRERECLLNVSAHLPSPFPFVNASA